MRPLQFYTKRNLYGNPDAFYAISWRYIIYRAGFSLSAGKSFVSSHIWSEYLFSLVQASSDLRKKLRQIPKATSSTKKGPKHVNRASQRICMPFNGRLDLFECWKFFKAFFHPAAFVKNICITSHDTGILFTSLKSLLFVVRRLDKDLIRWIYGCRDELVRPQNPRSCDNAPEYATRCLSVAHSVEL